MSRVLAALAGLALAGCATAAEPPGPDFLGVTTSLLDDDLVQFEVALTGAETAEAVETYADCAAAQYTLIRGQSFARLVRVNSGFTGGTWRADAVYTISPDLPRGRATIDAVVKVADCRALGIPTV